MVGPLIVATWNVWWRFGAWRERREAIATLLRQVRPDILGLQEVWAEDEDNLAARLATALGMEWTWSPSPNAEPWHQRLEGSTATVGNAILSRWPIAEHAELTLPSAPGAPASRTALLALIETPAGRLPFATTQLDSAPWDSALRCKQVRALVEFAAGHDRGEFPLVVAGDMNAEPDSDEIRLLEGHRTSPVRERLVLVDAWRYAEPGAVPWTWDRSNPHVRATMEPNARIDYVFVGLPRHDGLGHVRWWSGSGPRRSTASGRPTTRGLWSRLRPGRSRWRSTQPLATTSTP
jgi:endonuclease/exonuclease/phosphatase family metal-dependent hydrolase